ncbi:MAG TPA: family 1 glycosylhydrolase, partial [Kofleriaceae bacterium]
MCAAFPESFRFGLGDSDLQVIGERHTLEHEASEPTMWLRFAEARGAEADTTLAGVDRYHLWEADLDLLAELGIRHFRTSASVARVVRRDGTPNERAIEWYRTFLGGLRSRGIRTYVTLYHWELPQFLQDRGGWANRDTVDFLARHAAVVCEHLGDLIDEYFTINEPWCAAFLGHYRGVHAPGERSLAGALAAGHHLLLASAAMAEEVWSRRPDAKLGPVFSTMPCYALTSSEQDVRAAHIADA